MNIVHSRHTHHANDIVPSSYTGGVTVNAGILSINGNGGNSLGSGTLTLNGGEIRGTGASTAGVGYANAVQINGDVTISPYRIVPTLGANMGWAGTWTSSGTPGNGPVVTISQSPNFNSFAFRHASDVSNFTGTLTTTQYVANSGGTAIGFIGTAANSSNLSKAKFVVNTTTGNAVGINGNGVVTVGSAGTVGNKIQFGELSGNGRIVSAGATSSYLVEVGALGTNAVFSGDLVQWSAPTTLSLEGASSNLNIRKVGTGSLTLSGNNSYVGDTTIADGTLIAGIDALVSKANITRLGTGSMSISGGTFNNSISGDNPHGL